jgi:hypothetical protein
MTDKANETPESIGIRVARTHLLHARQINAVEESVNMHMGGDATVGELVSLMIVMGWKPPGDQAVAGAAQYRKKPVVIEAMQFTFPPDPALVAWCPALCDIRIRNAGYPYSKGEADIVTLEDGSDNRAKHVATEGDWIIRGVKGEFYPCKPDIFAATYEPVAGAAADATYFCEVCGHGIVIDAIVRHDVWEIIKPEGKDRGCGILCANCMVAALSRKTDWPSVLMVKGYPGCANLPAQPEPVAGAASVQMTYTNWRGETSRRAIIPRHVWFGSTDWHPEPQWLLKAIDTEKGEMRDFALKDFGRPEPVAGAAQCCMCGKPGLSTAKDGGPGGELDDGRWVCSSGCYQIAIWVLLDPFAGRTIPTADELSNIIRTVDGNHSLGAGELAERILSALAQKGGE